jgi:phage terminase large subunit-like protein
MTARKRKSAEPRAPGTPRTKRVNWTHPRIIKFRDLFDLSPADRARFLAALDDDSSFELLYDWKFWGRPEQKPPPGDWIYWLILAGRGAGKTRAGAEAVREWSKTFAFVNLIGATHDDVRDIMVLGESGLLAICPPEERPEYTRASSRLSWPNGAVSLLFSAEEPDRLRGKQHMKLWLDEVAAWRYPDAFEQALLGLRLGDKPQVVITTTPRPIKLIKQLVEDKNTIVTRGSTFDNEHHLAAAFLQRIAARYQGRTIGRQELFAEIVEEAPGALWTRALIERQRLAPSETSAEYSEVVIGVDPPAKSGASADECGIIVVGKTSQGAIHVLADLTSQGDTPGKWAARVGAAFRRFKANRVVAEINNGGEMVVEVLRQSDPNLAVRAVTATRGKFLRAEPVATAYERGIVHHLGAFEKLEDQLCTLTPDFDARIAGFSPDRADALVWAIADLIAPDHASPQALLDYYAQAVKKPS